MARRASAEITSLELLLDTVCNAFGGIVFITLLLAILSRNAGGKAADRPPSDPKEEVKRQRLLQEISEARADLRDAESDLASLRQVLESRDPAEEEEVLRARDAAERRRDELARERDARRAALAALRTKGTLAERQAAELRESVRATEKRVASLRQELKTARPVERRSLRAPRLHVSGRGRNIWVIVEDGQIFPCYYQYDRLRKEPRWLDCVRVTTFDRNWKCVPVPGTGQPIRGDFMSLSYCREIRILPPSTVSVHFAVHPSGFREFLLVRDRLVEAGYSYSWDPQEEGKPLYLEPADKIVDQ